MWEGNLDKINTVTGGAMRTPRSTQSQDKNWGCYRQTTAMLSAVPMFCTASVDTSDRQNFVFKTALGLVDEVILVLENVALVFAYLDENIHRKMTAFQPIYIFLGSRKDLILNLVK